MRNLGKNLVIVLALIGAGFFLAWLRFRPWLGREGGFTDGERRYTGASLQELRYAVWDEPEVLPATVNSAEAEGRPALSPDGRFLVFAVGERGLNADLWIAELIDGEPGPARPLAALNTAADELAPVFGEEALWFASDRPGTLGGLDLFRAPYRDGFFGPAEPAGAGVNGPYDETDPAPLPGSGGAVFAFASDRPRGARRDFDLWLATPADVTPLSAVNSPFDEREPAFAADGGTLFFASDRSGGAGGFDLWRSVADRGAWLPPEPLPGLNGPGDERGPAPSADGFSLVFRRGDPADLFRARSLELFPVPGRPVGWLDLAVLAGLLLLALLAWLAKRWETMDLIYKCVLAALVLHALLLLWFRRLYPDRPGIELPDREALFHVKLAATSAPSRAANRAFGGRLDTERAAVVTAEPVRTRTELRDEPLAAAPERRVERAAAELAPAPERRGSGPAPTAEVVAAAAAPDLRAPAGERQPIFAPAP
ncbi:MAG: hypothetical protein D6702_10715 [Planctomycetota bacterium]|nr:MAG: hypothetical protein D6702_10715 [Planctomycetota bacterium]